MTHDSIARFGLALFAGLSLLALPSVAVAQTVNIYSYREPGLIAPLLERFEKQTGIKPVVLFSDAGLIERVKAEGRNSPADLILTVDIGNLAAAKEAEIWQPLTGIPDLETVPEAYRDADGAWTALSLRARVFYVSRDRVPADLAEMSYDDLADPAWKGRVCTRSAQHVYSIGLIADYIAHNGLEAARDWLGKVRDNLAMRPTGNDRAQVKSVYAGQCDLAIGNTYYYGLMLNNTDEPEQKDWAASIRVVFPNRETTGTHVNVSGAILTRHAPNADN
ncbi:MAG: extracellular solute-binding protein, partial [Alphaproteobacteria bacterium]|nr:extracellular solute-binding protein [Alphaproteobacteria bacterium]